MGKFIEVGCLGSDHTGERFLFERGNTEVRGRISSVTHSNGYTMVSFAQNGKTETLVVEQPKRHWIRILYGNERT